MQRVLCPHCQNGIGYLDELAGQNMNCPQCDGLFQMPHLSQYFQAAVVASAPQRLKQRDHGPAFHGPPKNSGLAAVLSFLIFGLGQVYNGEIGKGVAIFVGAIVLGSTGLLFCLPFVGLVILWLWSVYDAYDTAERHNRRRAYLGR